MIEYVAMYDLGSGCINSLIICWVVMNKGKPECTGKTPSEVTSWETLHIHQRMYRNDL